jgi:hypothetical protein
VKAVPRCWLGTLSAQVALVEDGFATSETVPVKPLAGETVIVDEVVAPTRTGFGEAEPAAIEKS